MLLLLQLCDGETNFVSAPIPLSESDLKDALTSDVAKEFIWVHKLKPELQKQIEAWLKEIKDGERQR